MSDTCPVEHDGVCIALEVTGEDPGVARPSRGFSPGIDPADVRLRTGRHAGAGGAWP